MGDAARLSSVNVLIVAMEDAGLRRTDVPPKDQKIGEGSAALADLAGCSRQFIYQLLSGQRRFVKPITADRIEHALLGPVAKRSSLSRPIFVRTQSIRSGERKAKATAA